MSQHEYGPALDAAAALLGDAQRPVVMTGAGVSAESGISTFRDSDASNHPLWSQHDPMKLAHIDAFYTDPELVTRWYHWRFGRCKHAQPNPAHAALATLQAFRPATTLVTQNVDGLLQRAGATDVVELHGSILRWRCNDTFDQTGEFVAIEDIPFDTFPPRSAAGGILRPDVVWFGEMLPEEAIRRTIEAVETCDLFLTIGTSSVVYPAAGFVDAARLRNVPTIEINPDSTAASGIVDVCVREKAGIALPELLDRAFGPENIREIHP